MTESKTQVFRFADLEVHEREFRLTKAGEPLTIEPKVFRVLLFLLHHRERVVTKEELLDAVWGDAVVTENSLARSIAKLRRTLGDATGEPQFIATVPTVGYRLVCTVWASEDSAIATEPSARRWGADGSEIVEKLSMGGWAGVSGESPRRGGVDHETQTVTGPNRSQLPGARISRMRWRMLTGSLVVAGLAGAIWYLSHPRPTLAVTAYTQLTHDGRHKAIFGTDGARLFFDRYPGPQPLAQMPISGGDISTIPLAFQASWVNDISPDGSLFLVSGWESGQGSLWSVGVMGNSLRRLADGEIGASGWSPDGRWAVYSTDHGDIHTVRDDGSQDRKLGTVPRTIGSELFEQDSWSPDGRTIRFDRNNKIFEIGSDGSGLHEFLPSWHSSSWRCCGHWTRDGRFYLFVAWDAPLGTYPLHPPAQIWALDERRRLFNRQVAEPFQLTSGPIRWARPIPSKDGTKIYARGVIPNGELERIDPQSHQFQPYLHGISAESVSFSPDGKSVVYVSFPEGILWRAQRDGSGPVQLTDPPMYPEFARWSPDGMHILFGDAHFVGDNKSYILSAQGGTPEQILPGDKDGEQDAVWSPDGHRIALTSSETRDGNERSMIRVLDMASRQVTKLAGSEDRFSPRWSPDGKYLLALNQKDGSISVFDFQTRQWEKLFAKGGNGSPNWSRDGRLVYFVRAEEDCGVFRIRLSDRKVEKLVDLTGFRFTSVLGPWMGLDPDDTPLLMRDTGSDDIYALTLEKK